MLQSLIIAIFVLFNVALASNSTYNSASAISFANKYCAKDDEWLCAEFVARSLQAGGEFSGCTNFGSCEGYNLKYVSQLHKALLANGWYQSAGEAYNCGSAGDVLIYNIDGDSDAHAAFALGSCLLDQHNPSRCSHSSNWGPNIVLSKK
jgi:hypothetical protein